MLQATSFLYISFLRCTVLQFNVLLQRKLHHIFGHTIINGHRYLDLKYTSFFCSIDPYKYRVRKIFQVHRVRNVLFITCIWSTVQSSSHTDVKINSQFYKSQKKTRFLTLNSNNIALIAADLEFVRWRSRK